jgi:hypothetical protein
MDLIKNRIWIFLLIGLSNCNTNGHRGSSDSVEDSKHKGTFIAQYRVQSATDSVSEIIDNKIKEAFIEHSWFVKPPQSIIDTVAVNLVLTMKTDDITIFTNEYHIKTGKVSLFTQHSENKLWLLQNNTDQDISTTALTKSDTLKFQLYRNERLLGDMYFIRNRASTLQSL